MNRFISIQRVKSQDFLTLALFILGCLFTQDLVQAQQPIPPTIPDTTKPEIPQPLPPLPEVIPPPTRQNRQIPLPPEAIPGSIVVKRFEIIGNTVLSPTEIEKIVKPYTLRQISFIELLEVPQKITQLYVEKGYITSGAVILPQKIEDRVVKIKIIPGTVEDIKIFGLKQLNQSYVRRRLEKATQPPLNQQKLLSALQLLQIDPLIANISAELSAGIQPNSSLLEVEITEADTFAIGLNIDNSQVVSVSTFSRQLELKENNFFGIGDRFNVAYINTDGSNTLSNLSYELPINPSNGTIRLTHNRAYNEIIQEPFKPLNIENKTQLYDITYTQPLHQSIYQKVSIGFNFTRESSQTTFLDDEPFPNIVGATDSDGKTTVTSLGFFQEYLRRNEKQVFFMRSQFLVGIDALGSTIDDNQPDSKFFAWRGYTEYLRALSQNNLLSVRSNIQLANDSLPPLKQYTAGGFFSVRGYPRNILIGDNGIFLSTEFRYAIIKNTNNQLTLEFIPFVDFGKVWNTNTELDRSINTLASIGAGLKLSVGKSLTARIDFGLPLVEIQSSGDSLQENGIYFSVKSNL